MRLRFLFLFSLFLFLSLISLAHAEGDINIPDIPQKLASQLGIDLFSADILASMIVLSIFLFPTMLLTRNSWAMILVGVGSLSLCVALGWMPVFVMVLMIALSAGGIALKAKKFFG